MGSEWSNASRYNSFNSWKGLAYYEHYKKTVGWLEGKESLPPPIECNLDPFAECNLTCGFCITQHYLRYHREEVGEMRKLPTEYMHNLVNFLADWGVKGLCISGGGEPSLHEGIPGIIAHAKKKGMEVAMFTNAVNISDKLAYEMMKCQWLTLSIDAANRQSYLAIKGKDRFAAVVANIKKLVDMRKTIPASKVILTFCSLILPENQYLLYEMCKLAKELGVQVFRLRPVDFERPDIASYHALELDIPAIKKQFEQCHEEETPNFQVYTTTHKFDANFHVQHNFKHCYPALILPILSDGKGYLCVDRKMESAFKLGSAYPEPEQILEWWGSDAHRSLIKSVDISKCSRCTGSEYNAQIENVVLEDAMCLSFP